MTVVPNRSQAGNRRPNARANGAANHVVAGASSVAGCDSSELPPVLFQLPNLNPSSSGKDTAVTASAVQGDALVDRRSDDQDQLSQPAAETGLTASAIASADIDDLKAKADDSAPDPGKDDASEGRSVASRLASYTMMSVALCMLVAWVYVVAKHVRSADPRRTAESSESSESDVEAMNTTASLEDTVANVERLAMGRSADLNSFSPKIKPSASTPKAASVTDSMNQVTNADQEKMARTDTTDQSVEDLMAEARAAATSVQQDLAMSTQAKQSAMPTEPVATMKLPVGDPAEADFGDLQTSNATSSLGTGANKVADRSVSKSVASKSDDQFNVTMPAAILSENTPAMAAASRLDNSVADMAQNEIGLQAEQLTAPLQASPADATTERLQASPASDSGTVIATTATPNPVTPPLPTAKVASNAPAQSDDSTRQYSKMPTGITNWLQYLPPQPKN